ncbi:glycine--tRNA ligase subunit beta [Radicibacter daui]|uniref:glycine--tRNA ligase subunit beta n=1 Tax=Radicibacter daui TaxID=3064829 RepID=UPI004046B2A9
MAELLFELFSEEIPARMQARAAEDLARLVTEGLKAVDMAPASTRALVTPRRLTLVMDGLPERSPDVAEERRGPRAGAPQQATDGFLKANNLDSLEACELRDTGKGEFYFLTINKPGRPLREVLSDILLKAVAELPWPKSMRWADRPFRYVRPLHSIIALVDGKVLEGALDMSGKLLAFGNETRGHRFLAPDAFTVTGFADYEAKLRAARVVLDREERKRLILEGATALAAEKGLELVPDDGLLEELAGLVEWPRPLIGRIDDVFMEVPKEVLVTSMRSHQKYLAVQEKGGKLAPWFIAVANVETADGGAAMRQGYERVLRARLSDARFFWDQDRKHRLEENLPQLEKIVFHAKLGTLSQRVTRMQALSAEIARRLGGDVAAARSAAELAKADLVSGMVGEFPELQGVMGRYYALHQGESAVVADAIATHYSPAGPSDDCPSAPVAVALALADKLDTLAGFFAIGETPTGSKDPYALRRAALGVIRIVLENGLTLSLSELFAEAHALYGRSDFAPAADVVAQLGAFFADRLKVYLRDRGVRHDMIAAVLALGGGDDLTRVVARAKALQDLLGSDDGANLLAAYRRAANIVRIEEKKDGPHDGAVDPARFAQGEESALHEALDAAARGAEPAIAGGAFEDAMRALATLRQPVDAFFDKVTVNADDPALRVNRLRLLSKIRATLNMVADFSQIEGG